MWFQSLSSSFTKCLSTINNLHFLWTPTNLCITLHFIPLIIDILLDLHFLLTRSISESPVYTIQYPELSFSKNKFWCIKESKGSSAVSQKSEKSQALLRQNIISNNLHWVTNFTLFRNFSNVLIVCLILFVIIIGIKKWNT